jgi:protein-L-isoaspartate(D-aspartate) O-methyltransferase
MVFCVRHLWTVFVAVWCLGILPHNSATGDYFQTLRNRLVEEEIIAAGVTDERVVQAMRTTPRHEFVPRGQVPYAYHDTALPIGDRQTISPPFVVAYMTEQLDPQPTDRVLEIGTGSGYQAAVLSPLVDEVYTIEIVDRLARRAEQTLKRLRYQNVFVRSGDGFKGWPEKAPFDKIIVTCSPEDIPQPLVDQLKEGGQMIIPIGERYQQNLVRVTKRDGRLEKEPLRATLFVPMTGAAETRRERHPDPTNPGVYNGSFEELEETNQAPAGWHYLRQAEVITEAETAPDGENYLALSSTEPGKDSRALQGLAIDGRAVGRLRVSAWVRGEELRPGPTPEHLPAIVLTFYDHQRAAIGNEILGPWTGSFDWTEVSANLRVPLQAREAIFRLGLQGGTGRLDVDHVRLAPSDSR